LRSRQGRCATFALDFCTFAFDYATFAFGYATQRQKAKAKDEKAKEARVTTFVPFAFCWLAFYCWQGCMPCLHCLL
jgi:hypothetical protein